MSPSNILALLTAAAQLAPEVENLISTVKTAITEGRDATAEELAEAVAGNQAASDATDAALAAM